MDLHRPVDIGGFRAKGNLFLAPTAGYSDAAYRAVCAELGCDLAFTEMVSAEALVRGSGKTEVLMERDEAEGDYAIQLFGPSPETLGKAAAMVAERWKPAVLDLNCGCPVPKIVKTGAGSALMRDPARIEAIVRAMAESSGLPVTAKIRLGWDESSINYLEAADAAVRGGAAAITLHARTRAQGYAGKADREAFYTLAAAIPVPLFASGDLFSAADAVDILSPRPDGKPGPVAVMFARGAMGDPFIFARARAAMAGLAEPLAGSAERLAAARRHFGLSLKYYDERTACVEFRKQACAYLKGLRGGAALRAMAVGCATPADYEKFFAAWERAAAELGAGPALLPG